MHSIIHTYDIAIDKLFEVPFMQNSTNRVLGLDFKFEFITDIS